MSVIPNRPNTVNGWTPEEAAALRYYGVDPNRATRNEYSVDFRNGIGYVSQVVSAVLPSAGAANAAPRPVEWTQQSLIGSNAVIPVIYGGRVRVGLLIVGIVERYGFLYITALIGRGELGGIDSVEIDGVTVGGGIIVQPFLGAPVQQVYAPLVQAYAAKGVTFNDTMNGYAYVVIVIPSSVTLPNVPRLTATVRGKKCIDPSHGSALIQSYNPVVALCDFITSPVYGLGKRYDQASATAAMQWCEDVVLPDAAGVLQPRKRISLALTEAKPVEDWFNHLQMYTGCAVWERGGTFYFRPLRAETPSRTITMGNIVGGTLRIARPSLRDLPNKVTVAYTDTTDAANWQTARQSAPKDTASLPAIRESTLSLPGIIRAAQAAADALERYNRFQVATTDVQFGAFDEALPYEPGEVIKIVIPPFGINADFRVVQVNDSGFGRYVVNAELYAESIYGSTPVITAPPINGGGMVPGLLPLVLSPPVTGVEETLQLPDGTWQSRMRFSWQPPTEGTAAFYFATLTDVTLTGQPVVIDSRQLGTTSYVSYPVLPGHTYQLSVYAVSAIGQASNTITSDPVAVVGKDFPPPNVQGFSAIEAGGDVFMGWQRPSDPDVAGFVIKVGPPGTPWDQMTQITDVDATTYVAFNQPEGTFDYAIKAKDNAGQLSAGAARGTVVVTHDAGKIVTRGPWPFTAYPLTTNHLNVDVYDPPVAVDPGVIVNYDPTGHWGDGADNPDDAVGTFDDSLVDVPIILPSTQDAWFNARGVDTGAVLTGDWHLVGDVGVIGGDASKVTLSIVASSDDVTYTPLPPSNVGTGRYFRMRMDIPAGVAVRTPKNWALLYTVQPTTEFGSIDVPASGVATVTLANNYSVYDSILVTIVGGANAAYARADNVQIGGGVDTFEVKLFTAQGAPTSGRASWSFQGT